MNRNSMQLKEKSPEYMKIGRDEHYIECLYGLKSTDDRNSQSALSIKVLHTRD